MKPWSKLSLASVVMVMLFAFVERTMADLGPNRELLTAFLVVSSLALSRKNSVALMAVLLVGSDLIIGNTNIFLFTWSGFLLPLLLAPALQRLTQQHPVKSLLLGTGFGLGANLFFFLWTNLGVWLLDSWNMYPNTLAGLAQSYLNALPFLRAQLTTTAVAVPVAIGLYLGAQALERVGRMNPTASLTPQRP